MDYITKSNSHSTVFHFIIYLTIMYKKNKILLTIGLFLLVGIWIYLFAGTSTDINTQSTDSTWTEDSLLAAADQAEFAIEEIQDKIDQAQLKIDAESDISAKAFYKKQLAKDLPKRQSIMQKNQQTVDRLKIEAKELGIELPVKQETVKQETVKQETVKQETVKQETVKQETVKQETVNNSIQNWNEDFNNEVSIPVINYVPEKQLEPSLKLKSI